MESLGEELLREILVKLPTRDLARCCCVSRLWRIVVQEPSFRRHHAMAAHVISGSGGAAAETLLVTEIRGLRTRLEAVVLNVSSGKHMCRIADLAGGYVPTNACNGFICLAANKVDWPQYVCNPVTGDKLKIPLPPEIKGAGLRLYAMGFSASTRQYKLFRLSFGDPKVARHYLDVYTLGGYGGWRRNPSLLPHRARNDCRSPPPVLIDGKLYVLTQPPEYNQASDKVIVIDVASEAHCICHLPEEFTGAVIAAMHAFDMSGQLCVAMRLAGDRWQDKPRGAWFDDGDKMLCYRLQDHLYKYDTSNNKHEAGGGSMKMQWDYHIQLPAIPRQEKQWWNVYSGYPPSLVSPRLAFASAMTSPQHIDEQELFEHALLQAVRCKKSFNPKKRYTTDAGLLGPTDDQRVAKRICKSTQ
ncbi:hypothetical protein ZWY2020_006740 [Hordeum vulgare]|nr:hypothetical protein ZWY2020_006740 [Hordeum vulgare]